MDFREYITQLEKNNGITKIKKNVDVDIERTGQESIAGGGVEFSSGAEGVGAGSTGGVALLFAMDSYGNGPASSLLTF